MERKSKRRGPPRGSDKATTEQATPEPPAAPKIDAAWQDTALLTAIVLFAFALRLIYVLQMRDSPLFDDLVMDEHYHDQWARAIAAGERYIEGPYFRAPLYPAFLAAIYKIFGPGYIVPRLIQAAIGSLSCALLFLIGRRVFGRTVGAVAGFIAAGYWMLIYFDGELLIPSLIVLLDLVVIWLLLRSVRDPGKLVYALAGLVLGLSAIGRPNILLFAPAIVIWLVLVHRSRALAYVACLTAGCLLAILPITIRNYVVGKDTVLISSQAGVNFFIGNNPEADGRTAIVPGTPGDWWGGYYAAIERAERARGQKLKPSEVSRYYFREVVSFISRQPADFLALMTLKLRLFWTRWEISNNKDIYFWTEHFTPIVKWLPLGFAVIGPLGIVGLMLCGHRRAELFPLWGFVLVYMLSVVMFFCTARYRAPILPPLILLAVYAVAQGLRALARRRWNALAGGLTGLILATLFVNIAPEGKQYRNDAFAYVRLGSAYARKDRLDQAVECYRQAVEIAPFFLTAHLKLGMLLRRTNQLDEAIAEFRAALATPRSVRLTGETDARVAQVHFNLGQALEERSDFREAQEHYRAALDLDPDCCPGLVRSRRRD